MGKLGLFKNRFILHGRKLKKIAKVAGISGFAGGAVGMSQAPSGHRKAGLVEGAIGGTAAVFGGKIIFRRIRGRIIPIRRIKKPSRLLPYRSAVTRFR